MIPPTALTLVAVQRTLGTVAPASGAGTFERTPAQYWLATARWDGLLPEEWGELVGELLDRSTVRLAVPVSVLGDRSGLEGHAPVVQSLEGDTVDSAGWPSSVHGILQPGEYVEIDGRLYQIMAPVSSDESGEAALALWPPLEADAGAPITVTDPTGEWYIEGDIESLHRGGNSYYVTIQLREAR